MSNILINNTYIQPTIPYASNTTEYLRINNAFVQAITIIYLIQQDTPESNTAYII